MWCSATDRINRIHFLMIVLTVMFTLGVMSSHGLVGDYVVVEEGILSGSGSVSAAGTASYRIPIDVPSGRSGMTPTVSLDYSSDLRTGLAGTGWTLSAGTQVVQRCNATVAQDSVVKSVTYTTSDRLCLNGQRMVQTAGGGDYGTYNANAIYRTELASFQRIKPLGTVVGAAPTGFEVTQRDGTRLIFGLVTGGNDGRVLVQGSSSLVRVWALSRIIDTYSNYMDYEYEKDASGEYQVKNIKYTGHAATSKTPEYVISMQYETRVDDIRNQYVSGASLKNSKRLTQITTSYDDVAIRHYYLDYASHVAGSSGHSRLEQVIECEAVTDTCLAPLSIDWKIGQSGWDPKTSLSNDNSGERYRIGDWDGDGINDLFIAYQPSGGDPIWKLSLGKNGYAGSSIPTEVDAAEVAGFTVYGYRLIDYNGDGRTDILRHGTSVTDEITITVYLSTGESAGAFEEELSTSITSKPDIKSFVLTDYDGDGLEDFVYIDSNGSMVGQRNSGGSFSSSETILALPPGPVEDQGSTFERSFQQICCALNLNNDGIADMRVRVAGLFEFPCPFGGGTCFGVVFRWAFMASTGTGYELIYDVIQANRLWEEAVDVNGDGLHDLSFFDMNGNGFIQINTGNGFLDPVPSVSIVSGTVTESRVGDYNNDGRQDRFLRTSNGNLYVMKSNGQGFDAASILSNSEDTFFSSNIVTADMNGNGMADLLTGLAGVNQVSTSTLELPPETCEELGLPSNCGGIELPTPPIEEPPAESTITLYLNKAKQSDVATRVTDGYGNIHEFTYEPMAKSESYSLDRSRVQAPYTRPFWGGKHIVSSLKTSDGIGSTYTLDYTYSSAVYETRGRGVLGFRTMSVTDTRYGITAVDGRSSVITYHQSYPKTGRIESEAQYQVDGESPIVVANTIWNEEVYGTQSPTRYFVYPSKITRDQYEVGGPSDSQLYNTYETDLSYNLVSEFGYLTGIAQTTKASGALDEYKTTYTITPKANTGTNWCLTGIDHVSIKREQSIGSVLKDQTREIDYEFDLAFCRTDKEHLFPNEVANLQTIREFSFDVYGNVIDTTLSGGENATYMNSLGFAPRRVHTAYDSSFQFPKDIVSCFDDEPSEDCLKTDDDNPATSLVWDHRYGVPDSSTDILGNVSSATFDNFGRIETSDFAEGDGADFEYTNCVINEVNSCWNALARMKVTQTTDSLESREILLDSLGRIVGEEYLSVGATIRAKTTYDALGRIQKRSNPYVVGETVFETQYYHDEINRVFQVDEPISEVDPTAIKSSFIDFDKFTTTITNAKGQITKRIVDPIGRIVKSYDANHTSSSEAELVSFVMYEYDAWDELLKTINKTDDSEISMTYDVRGRLESIDDPDRGLTNYRYDAADALVWRQDAKNQVRTFEYDNLGRLVKRMDQTVPTEFNYENSRINGGNSFGRLNSYQVDPSNDGHKVAFVYDALGRVTDENATVPSVIGYEPAGLFEFDYTYDQYGRLETITYPMTDDKDSTTNDALTRFAVEYGYSAGQINKVTNLNNTSEVFFTLNEADAWGNNKNVLLGNGLTSSRLHDNANGWLNSVKTGPGASSTVQDLAYVYDNIGNVFSRTDSFGDVKTETFSYDNLNRLTSSKLTNSTLTASENLAVTYSANGNIESKSDVGTVYNYDGYGPHQVSSVANGVSTVMSMEYDLNGNMSKRGGHNIDWSSFDKPTVIRTEGATSQFSYDANYNRYRHIEIVESRSAETIYVGGLFERHVSNLASGGTDAIGYRHAIVVNGERIATRNLVVAVGSGDGDSIPDIIDNCSLESNEDQLDTNSDGFGNRCDPDLNNDLWVNFVDLALWADSFLGVQDTDPITPGDQPNSTWNPDADFNGDGVINFVDLAIFQGYALVSGPGPAGSEAIGWYTRYFHKDHLMTVTKVSDEAGGVVSNFSYDAFGQSRNADTWEAWQSIEGPPEGSYWTPVTRGYTGHEQLYGVNLIHMNGRVYDPVLGRVISSDPVIQDPLNTQSFNRTSYVMNNPMRYVDPSGYRFCGINDYYNADIFCDAPDFLVPPIPSVLDFDTSTLPTQGPIKPRFRDREQNESFNAPGGGGVVSTGNSIVPVDNAGNKSSEVNVVIRKQWVLPDSIPEGQPIKVISQDEARKRYDNLAYEDIANKLPQEELDLINMLLNNPVLRAEMERLLNESVNYDYYGEKGAELGGLTVYRETDGTYGVYSTGIPRGRGAIAREPIDSSLGVPVFDVHPHPISGGNTNNPSPGDLSVSFRRNMPGVIIRRKGLLKKKMGTIIYKGACKDGREQDCNR